MPFLFCGKFSEVTGLNMVSIFSETEFDILNMCWGGTLLIKLSLWVVRKICVFVDR